MLGTLRVQVLLKVKGDSVFEPGWSPSQVGRPRSCLYVPGPPEYPKTRVFIPKCGVLSWVLLKSRYANPNQERWLSEIRALAPKYRKPFLAPGRLKLLQGEGVRSTWTSKILQIMGGVRFFGIFSVFCSCVVGFRPSDRKEGRQEETLRKEAGRKELLRNPDPLSPGP